MLFRAYKFPKDSDARTAVISLDRMLPVGIMTGLNAYRNADGSVMVGIFIEPSTWWEAWATQLLPKGLTRETEEEAWEELTEILDLVCISGHQVEMSAAVYTALSFGAPWAALGNAAESIRGGQWA